MILLYNVLSLYGASNQISQDIAKILDDEEQKCDAQGLSLTLTSSHFVEVRPNDIIFISAVIKNSSSLDQSSKIQLDIPQTWNIVPADHVTVNCPANESTLQIFAVKVPSLTLSGEYSLAVKLDEQMELVKIFVVPVKDFTAKLENEQEFYPNAPLELKMNCVNNSNIPLRIGLEMNLDPICDVAYNRDPIVILPKTNCEVGIQVDPHFELGKYKQFLLLKIVDLETLEVIFQTSLCLHFIPINAAKEDLYVRIPSHCSFVASGDQGDYSLGIEFGGAGIINEKRERYLEYYFFLPTGSENIFSYDLDQTVFFGMNEPNWDLRLGDTIYSLSPLTQYRYGRGAGLDFYGDFVSVGAHYTQNQCETDYDFREVCGFVELSPYQWMNISGNYLHKEESCIPTSNIVTFETEFDLPQKVYIDCEFGNNFVEHQGRHDTRAFYLEVEGNNFKDIWWNIEKMYAGSAFFGYYNYMDLFSAIIDFPVKANIRASLSTTRLRQNLINRCCSSDSVSQPWQRQYNATLSYQFSEKTAVNLNGLLLRAKDRNFCKEYDFFQKWMGISFSTFYKDYYLNVMPAFGAQEDYLKNGKENFLQQYYIFLGKEFSPYLQGALLYNGGNTNYYDARHWKNTWGGSINYRYQPGGNVNAFLQRIQSDREGLTTYQACININHTFRNLNTLQLLTQYFSYENYCSNEFLFLAAYTIPFDLIVGKRKDVGNLNGYVYDICKQDSISHALLSLDGKQTFSDAEGYFSFPNMPIGKRELKTVILPEGMTTQKSSTQSVKVVGGKETQVLVAVVPVCSISGELVLYSYKNDPFEKLQDYLNVSQEEKEDLLITQGGCKGIQVTIRHQTEQEEYTTVSNVFGRFHFPGLRPGVWEISVNQELLPDHHSIDKEKEIVEIKPEEKKDIVFKILPNKRKIQLLH